MIYVKNIFGRNNSIDIFCCDGNISYICNVVKSDI